MWRAVGLLVIAGGVLGYSGVFMLHDAHAVEPKRLPPVAAVTPALNTPAPPNATPQPVATPAPTPARPGLDSLTQAVAAIAAASGVQLGVSLIELGGNDPTNWNAGGAQQYEAASTYKLPAMMLEAQLVAEGGLDPNGQVCFQDSDYEDGWYDDYYDGACFTRQELVTRAGMHSDNTAGHMLVRDLGGAGAINAYAAQVGAQDSVFYDPNLTTADDLARILAVEARGEAGGAAAQAWLYPSMTNTEFEAGIPAGVPGGVQVIHKTGQLDPVVNDVAIVTGGASGPYVLAVMTDGADGDSGWGLIAQVSAAVWSYEATR